MAAKLHALIIAEFNNASTSDLPAVYPRLVIMYEFFRLIRGEAFLTVRPSVEEKQRQLYVMEDEIGNRLAEIKKMLNLQDESLHFRINEMKHSFDIN